MAAWPDDVTAILGGDVCVALAYRTPAEGVVMTPVTTLGMFDADAGTVTTTTSFGNWKKLVRIDADDRIALVYHARDHSGAELGHLIVAQGRATFPDRADGQWATESVIANLERFVPTPKTGRFWNWVGREYNEQRVPITIDVERLAVYDDDQSPEPSAVYGRPMSAAPAPQREPANGTGARVSPKRYAKRLERANHHLVGYVDADGFPTARRVRPRLDGDVLALDAPALPAGGRRAGVLAHWFEPRMIGQGSAVLTGWLDVGDDGARYAPHTARGYSIPASPLVISLGGGLAAKFGYRAAQKHGHVRDGVWQRSAS